MVFGCRGAAFWREGQRNERMRDCILIEGSWIASLTSPSYEFSPDGVEIVYAGTFW